MTGVFLGSAFGLGLAGNIHCLGMCGPIAMVVPFKKTSKFSRLLSILLYNAGRILVYATIGAIFGILGKGISLIGMQQYLAIFIGVMMILAVLVPQLLNGINPKSGKIFSWTVKLKAAFHKRFSKTSYRSLFVLGMLNGLLPCGLVYIAAAGSVLAESWAMGALYMALFGLGTLPTMVLLPYFSQYIKRPFQQKMRKLIPVVMVVMGLLFIIRGSNLGIPYLSPQVKAEKSCCEVKCH